MAEHTQVYHWRDGWYFQRALDGSVLIRQVDDNAKEVVRLGLIPARQWASIVAEVRGGGGNATTYAVACGLHGVDMDREQPHAETGPCLPLQAARGKTEG